MEATILGGEFVIWSKPCIRRNSCLTYSWVIRKTWLWGVIHLETSIPSKNEWDLAYGTLSKLDLLDTQVEGSVQWVLLEISWIHCWEFSTISRENNQWIAPSYPRGMAYRKRRQSRNAWNTERLLMVHRKAAVFMNTPCYPWLLDGQVEV